VTISLIIVNFNACDLLRESLESLEAQFRVPDEVIVVDNGSEDDSIDMVRLEFPWVRLLESETNLGFAAGNNLAIRESTGDVIVLLNNDTVASPGFVDELVASLDSDQFISAVSGTMVFRNQPDIVATSGINVFRDGLALDRNMGVKWRELSSTEEVFGPTGGAMAIRRSALKDVDLFPEPYFLYLEDVDLAWRLRLRGHRTVSNPAAWVLHHYSASAGEGSHFKDFYLARNRSWVLIRCWPRSIWRRNMTNVLIYEAGALAAALATGRWGSIRGRFAGWTSLFRLWRVRRIIQRRVTSTERELLYWLYPALSVHGYLRFRETLRSFIGRESSEPAVDERLCAPEEQHS
jgi:GT2 family glycosyltransferase